MPGLGPQTCGRSPNKKISPRGRHVTAECGKALQATTSKQGRRRRAEALAIASNRLKATQGVA